jgi:hypothetical protein
MPITRTPMIDDDGSGTTGTIINNAWKQEFYGQIDALAGNVWQSPPFNAADYGGTGGVTWTVTAGHVLVNRYVIVGNVMHWQVYIAGSTVAGSGNLLTMRIPAGRTAYSGTAATSQLYDGVHGPGFVTVPGGGGNTVWIQKTTEAPISPGANYMRFGMTLELL